MKNRFIEFHIIDYLENIYNDAIIILDTNSLLNLYRYSEETRDKYFEILSKVKGRLYLTEQITSEFYKNRYSLIANRTLFTKEIGDLMNFYNEKLLNILKNSSGENKYNSALSILKHEEELRISIIKEIELSSKKINQKLKTFKQNVDFKYIQGKDPILAKVVDIFEDKISVALSEKEKDDLYKEGEERYLKKIPPGYKDITKDFPDKYGDLVIWKELQVISKKLDKDILFISDDRKEDWVIKFKGMYLGPRKELIREFYQKTNKLFYSISTKEFIKLISEKYDVNNTENLEKETQIIYERVQEDGQQNVYKILKEIKKHKQILELEEIEKRQELLRKRINTFETYEKQQKLLRKKINSFETYEKQQELLIKKINPFEAYESPEELMRKIYNYRKELDKEGDKSKSNKKKSAKKKKK